MSLPVLQADCSQCFALCCVLLPFSKGESFPETKPGGRACHNLDVDDRCSIHATLTEDGWSGCVAFDCFGAGQQVSQVTYAGVSWREGGNLGEMAAVLSVMRQLHEMLALLDEADRRGASDAEPWVERLVALIGATADELLAQDIDELRREVGAVLAEASRIARSRWPDALDLAGQDLAGRDLRRLDLRGAALRGAVLLGVDLRECDLTDADLLGADLRGADARGADLSAALFLTIAQRAVLRS
ncbi:pentapeptide repeat-containing protein [Nocardioides sp.]|uniref:pentapeptide repeat-containing protein n=1 Tax=Nocardioides sp. TaxID=35761 RepID=UPI00286E5265|nr:pentapeptide repeat-containing protein [Nocardioides sp.]